jgi:hypothetical protein
MVFRPLLLYQQDRLQACMPHMISLGGLDHSRQCSHWHSHHCHGHRHHNIEHCLDTNGSHTVPTKPAFQAKASIDYATLTAGAQLPITAFIPALAGYGQETQTGMAAQFLESIANTANQSGQAMVGALA